jgi:hypothetical protein
MPVAEPNFAEFAEARWIRRQLFAFLGGPIAWMAQLFFTYAAVPYLCGSPAAPFLFAGASLAAFAVTCAALAVAWRCLREAGGGLQTEGPAELGRSRLLAWAGVAGSGYFLIVVAAQAVPFFFLDPCTR